MHLTFIFSFLFFLRLSSMQSEDAKSHWDKEWVPLFKKNFKEEAINIAAAWSKIEAVKILLEEGHSINNRGSLDKTPLHKACEMSSKKMSLFLIDKGADVNAKNWKKNTPLHVACHCTFPEEMLNVIEELIKKGAIVDALNTLGQTPLYIACAYQRKKVAELLLRNGADLFLNNTVFIGEELWQDNCPLKYLKEHYHSTNQSNLNIFDCIIKCEGRYFEKGTYGIKGLCKACADGELEIVKWFIEEKVYFLSDCPYLLCYAAQGGNIDLVSYLIDQGASVNTQDAQGKSPLHHVCISFCPEEKIAIYLIEEKGVNLHAKDTEGRTPLYYALKAKRDLAFFLMKKERNINFIVDEKKRRTALHIAARAGFLRAVKFIIERGANKKIKDKKMQTALQCAVNNFLKNSLQKAPDYRKGEKLSIDSQLSTRI